MKQKGFNVWIGIAVVLLAFFTLFVVYPLAQVLYKSVLASNTSELTFTLDYFDKFFARKYYWSTLVNSFYVTVASTLLASLIGLPMAYLLRSYKVPGSKYLNILIVISYLSPPFIGAYAWIQLFGRNGFWTKFLTESFGWHVIEVDGNNIEQFIDACAMARAMTEKPVMIIAHTVPGKGVDFMENDL